jgi:hypothetical protein
MSRTVQLASVPNGDRTAGWVAVAATAAFFQIVTFLYLDGYYSTHLPHYDAMGSYTTMFAIINAYRTEGWITALSLAAHYDLSWLQGFFAAVGAPLLETTAASVQLYNTLCVLAAMSAIFIAASTKGLSALKAYVVSLCVFVPDVFYEVQGGLADLSRDPSYVMLMAASFFAWLAFQWRPTIGRSAFFGFLCGLTTLSRSSAFPFQVFMFGPLLAWSAFVAWRQSTFLVFCRRLLPAVVLFSMIAGAFLVLRFGTQMDRYRNPYVAYAIGDSVLASVQVHWTKPAELLVGQLIKANSLQVGGRIVSAWAGGAAMVACVLLIWAGVVRFSVREAWDDPRNRYLAAAGAWVFSGTLLLVFLVAKPKELSFPEAKYPFYPTMLGFFAASLFLVQCVRPGRRVAGIARPAALAVAMIVALTIAVAGFARSRSKQLHGDAIEIGTVLGIGERIRKDDGQPPTVAFLWQEGINIDSIKFYAAARGYRAPVKLFYEFGGQWQDFDVTAPAGVDPADMMRAAEAAVMKMADIIVCSTDLNDYRVKQSRNPLFQEGAPMVERLLATDLFVHDYVFTFRGDHFVVLRRKSAQR